MSLPDAIQRVSRSVAWIRIERDAGSESLGSGFLAGRRGQLLTCAHILRDARRIEATVLGAHAPSPATVLETDLAADTALLEIESESEGRDLPPAPLWRGPPVALGREVAFIGFPHADVFQPPLAMTMRGIIGNRYRLGTAEYYVVDAVVSEGMSGAPLFLADSGEVVGVVGARFDPARTRAKLAGVPDDQARAAPAERTSITFASSIEYALALLKKRA